MQQLDAGVRNGCVSEAFESEDYVHRRFDVAMILLDQGAILRSSQRHALGQQSVGPHFANRVETPRSRRTRSFLELASGS
jgi:hypothetical protein